MIENFCNDITEQHYGDCTKIEKLLIENAIVREGYRRGQVCIKYSYTLLYDKPYHRFLRVYVRDGDFEKDSLLFSLREVVSKFNFPCLIVINDPKNYEWSYSDRTEIPNRTFCSVENDSEAAKAIRLCTMLQLLKNWIYYTHDRDVVVSEFENLDNFGSTVQYSFRISEEGTSIMKYAQNLQTILQPGPCLTKMDLNRAVNRSSGVLVIGLRESLKLLGFKIH